VPVAPSTVKNDQFLTWINVSSKGTIGVTWLERRNDASTLTMICLPLSPAMVAPASQPPRS